MKRRHPSDFDTFILDQLSGLPGLIARPMFGGVGLYAGTRFFGILHQGQLFFKTNQSTRHDFQSRGAGPFRPSARQTLHNYYEVPPEIIDDREVLLQWAARAVAIEPPPKPAAPKSARKKRTPGDRG